MKMKHLTLFVVLFSTLSITGCNSEQTKKPKISEDGWAVDFFDDFDTFNTDNWQDQRI